MALTLFLTGIIYMIAGVWVYKFPPKKINPLYGYRTGKSMKSQQAWDLAQPFAGKLMAKLGAIFCIIGLPLFCISFSQTTEILLSLASILLILASVIILIYKTNAYIDQKIKY